MRSQGSQDLHCCPPQVFERAGCLVGVYGLGDGSSAAVVAAGLAAAPAGMVVGVPGIGGGGGGGGGGLGAAAVVEGGLMLAN